MAVNTDESRDSRMNKQIKIRKRGQITLPKELLEKFDLAEGDNLEIEVTAQGDIKLTPMISIPKDQEWFWTEEWQKGEREADEDIQEGRVKSFDNVEDLIADLENDEIEDSTEED